MLSIFSRRTRLIALLLAGVILCGASQASAEDDPLSISVIPYLWVPWINSQFSFNEVPVEMEIKTEGDFFDTLDFGLLVAGEVRKGKVGLFYDFQYLKISGEDTTSGPSPRAFDAAVSYGSATLALQYRFIQKPAFTLDAFAGARLFYADLEADVAAGALLPALSGDASKTWVDPIVGAKGAWHFSDKWALHAYADVGGFSASSDLTYQAMTTVSYRFNEHFAIHAGYRIFAVDFERGSFEFDVTVHGPLVGFAFQF